MSKVKLRQNCGAQYSKWQGIPKEWNVCIVEEMIQKKKIVGKPSA
jgi:hypothetical protein